jgi:ferredoxin
MRADDLKIRVDLELCVGHGRCYMLAPEVYDEDDRGHCLLRLEDVPPDLEDRARMGAANCPEGAIEIAQEKT